MKTLDINWAERRRLYFLTFGEASGAAGRAVFDARSMLEPDEEQAKRIGWVREDGEQQGQFYVEISADHLEADAGLDMPDLLFEALKDLATTARWRYGDPGDIKLLKLLEMI